MIYQDKVAVPELTDNQVLIKIAYAGINPVDYKTRQGKGWGADNIRRDNFAQDKPAILGFDVAGTVAKSHSDKFTVGDKVAALSFTGSCYAEYVAVDAELLALVPESVTLEQAGALPCVGQTAMLFVNFADIKYLMASGYVKCSCSIKKVTAFPPFPDEKSFQICFTGDTINEGDFSFTNGLNPFKLLPARNISCARISICAFKISLRGSERV